MRDENVTGGGGSVRRITGTLAGAENGRDGTEPGPSPFPPLAIDLFAGTAGATAAFLRHGWDVVAVDIAPAAAAAAAGRTPARRWIIADVRALPITWAGGRRVDFLWASPPCTEFSHADARVDHRTKRPSLELVFATMAAVRLLRPRFWIMENVRGAIPFLGIPAQKIGPWCLWGYFPEVRPSFAAQTYEKCTAGHKAAARAAIPRELSEAVYRAVELARAAAIESLLDLRPFRRHRHRASRVGRPTSVADLFAPGAEPAPPSLDTPR